MTVCFNCLTKLRDKRTSWLTWVNGSDRHAIANQLSQMAWDFASFEMVVEAFRFAPSSPNGGKQLNGLIFGLLQRCFLQSLLSGFRRLMDDSSPNGSRGVYSLKNLLEDLSSHANLFTREALLQVEVDDRNNCDYDYSDEMWNMFERSRNEQIDRLVGVTECNRTDSDAIPSKVFDDRLESLEKNFCGIKPHVDKFIAHAATPDSRRSTNLVSLPLEYLRGFHSDLCKVAYFLQGEVFGQPNPSFLPHPIFDQFEYINHALVLSRDIPALEERWRELEAEHEPWRDSPSPSVEV